MCDRSPLYPWLQAKFELIDWIDQIVTLIQHFQIAVLYDLLKALYRYLCSLNVHQFVHHAFRLSRQL